MAPDQNNVVTNEDKHTLNVDPPYKGIVEDQAEIICRLKPDGIFIFVNDIFCRFFGKERSELIGQKWSPMAHPDDLEMINGTLALLTQDNPVVPIENRVYSGKGELHWMQFINRASFDEQGNLLDIQSIGRDITDRKLAEQQLKQQSEILNVAANGIALLDRGGRVVYMNPAFGLLTGYSEAELIGRDLRVLKSGKQSPEVYKELWETLLAGRVWRGEITNQRKDGSIYTEEQVNTPLLNESGEVTHFISVRSDITERKQAETELQLHSAIYLSMAEGVVVIDDQDVIRLTNPAYEKMFGYEPGELKGKSAVILNGIPEEESQKLIMGIREGLRQGKSWEGEFTNRKKDGSIFYTSARIQPINYAGQEWSVSVQEDITERKNAEKVLLAQKSRAEEADRLKTAFLANMSHEIRTPLNAIIGYTELTLEEANPDSQKENLNIIKERGAQLLEIINDILDLSRIEANQVNIHESPISVRELLGVAIKTMDVLLRRKSIAVEIRETLDANIPEYILGDRYRLLQVMNNLISNSVKFTSGGYIEIGARLISSEESQKICFFVGDTGKGIAEDKLKSVFNPFTQEDLTITRNFGGTGLGLTISKKLVELMGGIMDIKSSTDQDHGTLISFSIPYVASGAPVAAENENQIEDVVIQKGRRVLVVEDDPDSRNLACKILEKNGCSVTVAVNGAEAVQSYELESNLDLILMDVQMPVKDGLTATGEIREIEARRGVRNPIPILALSAAARREDIERGLSAGITRYLTKPLNKGELLKYLNVYLG